MEILLVEDSHEDAELTMRALSKQKIINEVKWIEDGQEALDYLFATGKYAGQEIDRPKVVLLDLKLPKVTGMEILEKIKRDRELQKIPVVILTSSKEDIDIQNAYKLGANSYIVKPVDFEKFAESIKQLGVYWVMLNENP